MGGQVREGESRVDTTGDKHLCDLAAKLYMGSLVVKALEQAFGKVERIEAWYREERVPCPSPQGTFKETCWFLTDTALVRVEAAALAITITSFMRRHIVRIEREFALRHGYGHTEHLKRVRVSFAGGDPLDLEEPADLDEDHVKGFIKLIRLLG